MSIKSRLLNLKANLINLTQAGSPLTLDNISDWSGSKYGKRITEKQLLSLTASWRSLKLLSETVGSMPLNVMEKTNDVPRKAVEHPLYDKLHNKSSQFQTADAFVEQLVISLCLWNEAYIYHPGIGNRSELFALSPATVTPKISANGTDIEYHRVIKGSTVVLTSDEITRVEGFKMPSALESMTLAGLQSEAFTLAMGAEEYGARFFANGGKPSGVLSTQTVLKPEQREQLREKYASLINKGDVKDMGGLAVLEGGFKYTPISTNPEEAQFLGTRKHQVNEIARIFGVPPHMLFEMDRATYANAELNNREFLQYTLLPYLRRIEKTIECFILSEADRKKYFIKFSVEGLLRGDTAGRAAYYREGRVGGWLTQNEIRGYEDLPRKDGADDLHVPLNMTPSDLLRDIQDTSDK